MAYTRVGLKLELAPLSKYRLTRTFSLSFTTCLFFHPAISMAAQAPPNIDPNSAVYATDEYGRPFIIVREGQRKSRLSGIEAIRVSSKEKKTARTSTGHYRADLESSKAD